MKYFAFSIVLLIMTSKVSAAQSYLDVTLSSMSVSGDTVQVTLNIGSAEDSLMVPLRSFQFEIEHDSTITLLSAEYSMTLSDKFGWTVAANMERKRVGGFGSSNSAIVKSGPLLVLLLIDSSGDSNSRICLAGLRFNSDNPLAKPLKPCLAL